MIFCGCIFAQQDSTQILGIAKIIKIYDGDTFYGDLYGVPSIFGKDIGIRLSGIDTPEINSPDSCNRALARQARDYLTQRLYFRLDAIVYVDGINLNQEMVAKGYAKTYTGEGPRPVHTCSK